MEITIGNKTYELEASALTPFIYAQVTGNRSEFFEELGKLQDYYKDGEVILTIKDFGKVNNFVLYLAYALIKQNYKENKMTFEDFADSIKNYGDQKWFQQVLQVALSTFQGSVQNADQQQQKQ